jgi:hypothetical protein
VPAIAEIGHVKMREMTTAYFDFHQHFVSPGQWFDSRWGFGGSVRGPNDQMSFQIGPVQWLAIGAALLAIAVDARTRLARAKEDAGPAPSANENPRRTGLIVLWLAIVAAMLFLMTSASVGVWERVPALAYLQFPWRLLMAIAVAASALVALLLSRVRSTRLQAIAGLAIVLAHVMLVDEHLRPSGYFHGTALAIDQRGWHDADPAKSSAFIESGYHPIGVRQLPGGIIGRWTVTRGEGLVRAHTVRDDELTLEVETPEGLRLTINTPYFPGWTIAVDGREVAAAVHPESGFMQVTIPAGRHTLDARLVDTEIRHWANLLSAGSLALFAIWMMFAF